jgi:hypothetical protein
LCDRRSEEVWAGNAPKNLALGASSNAGAEERSSRAIDRPIAATGYFMERAESEAAVRESRVHVGYSKGKYRSGAPVSAFDPFDLCAQ